MLNIYLLHYYSFNCNKVLIQIMRLPSSHKQETPLRINKAPIRL
jgi:hypothetical protein